MTVTELINLLEAMPDDIEVVIASKDGLFELKGVEYDSDMDAVVLFP